MNEQTVNNMNEYAQDIISCVSKVFLYDRKDFAYLSPYMIKKAYKNLITRLS